jgi:chromosome partitioning protein
MRIDTRTRADDTLQTWARAIGLPFLGVLRDTRIYVRCIERGLTIFDLPPARTQADRDQWSAILDWLDPLWVSRELATPSQADALQQQAEIAAAAPRVDAEGRPLQRPVRVTPAPRLASAKVSELAAALAPVAPPNSRGWLRQAFGWLG